MMIRNQFILFFIAAISLTLVGVAVYLQETMAMFPCPLCIIQRYLFILVAITSLIGIIPHASIQKKSALLALFFSFLGCLLGLDLIYLASHPTVDIECGRDALQMAVNQLPFARWMPTTFTANGLCGDTYEAILGLTVPQWSVVWFAIFITALLFVFRQSKKHLS